MVSAPVLFARLLRSGCRWKIDGQARLRRDLEAVFWPFLRRKTPLRLPLVAGRPVLCSLQELDFSLLTRLSKGAPNEKTPVSISGGDSWFWNCRMVECGR